MAGADGGLCGVVTGRVEGNERALAVGETLGLCGCAQASSFGTAVALRFSSVRAGARELRAVNCPRRTWGTVVSGVKVGRNGVN